MPDNARFTANLTQKPRLPDGIHRRRKGGSDVMEPAEQLANLNQSLIAPGPRMNPLALDMNKGFPALLVKARTGDARRCGESCIG